MSQPKQFLVYQQQRSHTPGPAQARHVIVAGPFEEEAQAEAVARRRWDRDAKTAVREIGDTLGLHPEPVGCRCDEQAPDPVCLIGPYLVERGMALGTLIEPVGFNYLPAFLQGHLEHQRERWQGKYLLHLSQERSHEA
ncbi:hypothetical protein KSF_087030 [Reticulibacter mediterranei]|uniref:Uncharacterized protein n=1 Tax=Reticulibacter mediterranei TaxID=2778369 RepID=A0A8J3IXK5_9CHLR|nr:hypothetical protein [Reticulibacter mediterranei]GHO98655.1 hypothetical protein KSF_087030 [Reticulibacter mediterranei]